MEAAQKASEGQAGRLSHEVERLRKRTQELENEVAKLNRIIDEAKLQESRLGERAVRLEVPSALSLIVWKRNTYIYNDNPKANVTWTSHVLRFSAT